MPERSAKLRTSKLLAMISGRLIAATLFAIAVVLGFIYLGDSAAEALRMVILDPFLGEP